MWKPQFVEWPPNIGTGGAGDRRAAGLIDADGGLFDTLKVSTFHGLRW
jgi:hypothetical protein